MNKRSAGTRELRIISGKNRGRKIQCPRGEGIRPTKDRIRESVFDMIAPYVTGAEVLDLFAGSGAYGFEALSRGAERAVFIDNAYECVEAINNNAASLGDTDRTLALLFDIRDPEGSFGVLEGGFSLVFSDPPYNKGLSKNTLIMVNQYDILMPSGFLVTEHHKQEDMPEKEGGLSIFKRKAYGDVCISIYARA